MATINGRDYIRYEDRLTETCVYCTAPGMCWRKGSLLCTTHAWEQAMDQAQAVFAGEVRA